MEKVITDTESLFKTREKEYQETIDQIEVRMRVEAEQRRFPVGVGGAAGSVVPSCKPRHQASLSFGGRCERPAVEPLVGS